MKVGDVAGHKLSEGYLQISANSKIYFAHRLAWLYITGEWPKDSIDHINEIKHDNRFFNLREATRSQNMMNRGALKNNTSGLKGVSLKKSSGKWRARVGIRGKSKHLGYFNNPEDAYKAYCEAAKKLHGEFANF